MLQTCPSLPSQGGALHLFRSQGGAKVKTLSLAGAKVEPRGVSRPRDAWRNLFALTLAMPAAKTYVLSASTAELQVTLP